MKTYIIGHQKPDTDSVVAAMALEFLNKQEPNRPGHENSTAAIIDPINPETKFLLNKFGVNAPVLISAQDIKPEDQIILVDHNEESQRLAGLNPEQIINIIDHHKANINFSKPICLIFRPWGSSCSIIYYMMKQKNVKPDKTLAALMLAAILSDTVGFKSSTSTNFDEILAKELQKIAEITDLDSFVLEIFKAKSDISKLSDKQIVLNDYKIFNFDNKKVLIDQLETVEQAEIINKKKDRLLAAMAEVKKEQNVDLIFVVISDILQVNSKILLLGDDEKRVAESAFNAKSQNQIIDIGPKLSRKKEIAPAIEQALNQS